MDEAKTKRTLPPKAKDYLDLVKASYQAGFRPLSKAMKEAGRIWRLKEQGPKS